MYEFWQGANGYGLVQMLTSEQEAAIAEQDPNESQSISVLRQNAGKVTETRQTELGTLRIYQDFMNYKASLNATSEIRLSTDEDLVGSEALIRRSPGLLEKSFPWLSTTESQIPESPVNWTRVEMGSGNG